MWAVAAVAAAARRRWRQRSRKRSGSAAAVAAAAAARRLRWQLGGSLAAVVVPAVAGALVVEAGAESEWQRRR
jgi:hypothetical protein